MKKFIFFLTCFLVVSISYVTYYYLPHTKEEYYENGHIKIKYSIKKNAPDGSYTEYYDNGNVKLVTQFVKGNQNGKTITYYENAHVEREVSFVNGVQNDSMKLYFPDGKISEIGFFAMGKQEGLFKSFYKDGSEKLRGKFISGKKNDTWIEYDEKGNLELIFYKKGAIESRFFLNSYQNYKFNYELKLPAGWNITTEGGTLRRSQGRRKNYLQQVLQL
ncbi:MAG: toxin-antitoxin system YwqK family antitoxin [Cyclobacteriaceae bacterium]|nr:toxin-antitoxin system YwqK family antitoxin [Cyclobacteriaceae bacterium]